MSDRQITQRQEAFAQGIVAGTLNQSDVYRAAGYSQDCTEKTINEAASRLMLNSKVVARVAEIRAPAVEAAQISLKGHLDRLQRLSELAEEAKQYSSATAAEISRGRASGLYVERHEDVTDPFKKALSGMTAEEAQSMLDAMEQVKVIQAKATN